MSIKSYDTTGPVENTPSQGSVNPISAGWAYSHVDTDAAAASKHHTLGKGANQAASGGDKRIIASQFITARLLGAR